MDSSYITFLKKNGVKSPQGYRTDDYEGDDIPEGSVGVSFEEGVMGETSPPSPDGEGDPKGRDGGQ